MPALAVGASLLAYTSHVQADDTSAELEAYLSLGHECKIVGDDLNINLNEFIVDDKAERTVNGFELSQNGTTLWAITATEDVSGPMTDAGFELNGGLTLDSDLSDGDEQEIAGAADLSVTVTAYIEDAGGFEAETNYRSRAVLTCVAGCEGGGGGYDDKRDSGAGNAGEGADGEDGDCDPGNSGGNNNAPDSPPGLDRGE